MVTAGNLPFRENSHGRAGNRTRDLMISRQRLWPLDHEAGRSKVKRLKEISTLTLLFADDHVIIRDSEDKLQKCIYLLNQMNKDYNLKISTDKTKDFG